MNLQLQVSKMVWEVDAKTPIVNKTAARLFKVPPMVRELCGYEWTPGQLRQLPVADYLAIDTRVLAWANCDFDGIGAHQRMAIVSTDMGLICAYYLDGTPQRTPEEKTRDECVVEMYPQLILKS